MGGGDFLIDDVQDNSSQTTVVHLCSEIYTVAEDIGTFILALPSQIFLLFELRELTWTGFEITLRWVLVAVVTVAAAEAVMSILITYTPIPNPEAEYLIV